jgi:3,4-dihydroxy 2-butanone 4-phosphate synthase / GTP cyclohydrolase II
MKNFDTIEEAIEDIKAGKIVIVVDDEDRENEGDFIMAANAVTPEKINFMATHGRGMICAPITKEIAVNLGLAPMVGSNQCSRETAFTITIDAKENITTGISAADRSQTIKLLTDPKTVALDFIRPGHIFPLIAKDNGVIERNGHTEAAVDLAELAGFNKAGVICEIMNADGSMSRLEDLVVLKKKFNLKLITIKDLITYRQRTEINMSLMETIDFPNKFGEFKLHIFTHTWDNKETVVLTKGPIMDSEDLLVRVHSECFTGDVFGSKKCDCGSQLDTSMNMIEKNGSGMVIYLQQEGRGIGLVNKIKAYKLQEMGLDTVEANNKLGFKSELRDFSAAAQVLRFYDVKSIKLLTNNPFKIKQLRELDITINERVPIEIESNSTNKDYLMTKKAKMGHLLEQFSVH